MKKLFNPLLLLLVLLASCYSGPRGQLVGVQDREDWYQVNPYGMNYIHFGSYGFYNSDRPITTE